jgi:hypothetical protein
MATKDFGLKGIRFVGDFGTPKITSPIGVDINATKVAISTDVTVGRDLSVTGISTLGGVKISSGIVTSATGVAVTFVGSLLGNASTATTSTNIGAGDTGSVPYQSAAGITTFLSAPGATDQVLVFNDDTQQPSWALVELGTNTSGNYVKELTGTANQIVLTPSEIGAGATHTISLATNPTIQGNLEVKQNLNVLGNITIGGTTAFLNAQVLQIRDKDIVLGITTDSNGNDVSTDTTANHGGVAIASTEGTPLVDINAPGIDDIPSTYKQIMWLKSGTLAGLNTDAWLSNYAFGVGTTSMSAGTVFAAGNVQISNDDIRAVRNINATGITTVGTGNTGIVINGTDGTIKSLGTTTVTLTGNLTGTATTATNIGSGNTGSLPYQSSPGITTFLSAGTDGQVLLYNEDSGQPEWKDISAAAGAGSSIASDESGGVRFLTYTDGTGIKTSLGVDQNGLVYSPSDNKFGIGTTAPDYTLHVQGDVKITGAIRDVNSGIGTNNQIITSDGNGGWSWQNFTAVGAIGGVTINDDTASTPQYLLFTSATEGEISSQNVSSTNLVYSPTTGKLGIGTTVASERLQVQGNISINGNTSYGAVTASTAGITTTAIYSGLSTSTYRSVEYTIQATQGSNYHVTKILSFHDGSIAYNSEYGMMYNNESVGAFDVDISGGNIRLLVVPASASSTTYTVNFIATKI